MRSALGLSNIVIAAGFSLALTHAAIASAAEWHVSERLTVVELGEGVWLHTSWQTLPGGSRFPANGLVVHHGEGVVLVDTAWGNEATAELLSWVDDHLGQPVLGAIVTHFHEDSMGGIPVLSARGIPVWGHAMTRALGADAGVPLPASYGDPAPGETLQVLGLEVFYPGPGHTRDNTVVWVASAGVLFGTCMIRSPTYPGTGNTADADMPGWPAAVGRVLTRYGGARIVVPGHGPPGDEVLLTHTIGLFRSTSDRARPVPSR